jgi:hypothetical protein
MQTCSECKGLWRGVALAPFFGAPRFSNVFKEWHLYDTHDIYIGAYPVCAYARALRVIDPPFSPSLAVIGSITLCKRAKNPCHTRTL